MAGFKTSFKVSLPNFSIRLAHAAGTGTSHRHPAVCRYFIVAVRLQSLLRYVRDCPLAFMPCSSPFIQAIMKASPPIPLLVGSTTVNVAAVATAASIALPPCFNTSMPASVASGCRCNHPVFCIYTVATVLIWIIIMFHEIPLILLF